MDSQSSQKFSASHTSQSKFTHHSGHFFQVQPYRQNIITSPIYFNPLGNRHFSTWKTMENNGILRLSEFAECSRRLQASPAHLRPITGRSSRRAPAPPGASSARCSRLSPLVEPSRPGTEALAGKYDQKYGRNMTMLEGWQRIKFHPSSNLQIFNK